jgi:hypothetical protein
MVRQLLDPTARLAGACLLVAALVASACASRRATARGTPDLITAAEIEEYRASGTRDLHELIQRARPRWLQSRGERSLHLETQIVVYQDQLKLGGIEVLKELPLEQIAAIRRLDSARAGLLPGARDVHVEAAIVIEMTKRQARG